MQPVNYRLEVSGTLVWMAACTVIAMQYTSKPGTLAACAGAMLGCLIARWTGRRSARLETAITLCPFVCALLLLVCAGLHQSQFVGTVAGLPACELAEIVLWGGTALCVSLALDLLKAEFPQAAALRIVLVVVSFASLLPVHQRPYSVIDFILRAERDPVNFFLLVGGVIAMGAVISSLASLRFHSVVAKSRTLLTGLHALLPQGRLNPSASPLKLPSELR